MASYYIFGDISTIASQILMVREVNFVFSFLNSRNLTSYQTQFIKPNLLNQICTLETKPNLLNQIYQSQSTLPNLQNQVYQAKCLECKEPSLPKQKYQTKSIQSNIKTKSTQQILPN